MSRSISPSIGAKPQAMLRNSSEVSASSTFARLKAVPWPALTLASVETAILRDESVVPVRGSFGSMTYRISLFVRITDSDGCQGYGEVWCNFPMGGAQYKANLIRFYVRPLLIGPCFQHPSDALDLLEGQLATLALQSGDFGAMSQVMAGIDQCMWDLACKKLKQPFWSLAGGHTRVLVYASGIGPDRVAETIRQQAARGHIRFKLKLGFGDQIDRRNLDIAFRALPIGGTLLTDANQAWTPTVAAHWLSELESRGVLWCEEPVPADTLNSDWRRLAAPLQSLRLAAGENLRTLPTMLAAVNDGAIRVIQPDIGKWGGVTGMLLLEEQLPAGVWLCPHWLSGAIGQSASLQIAAALRSQAPVEMDANPNALRTDLFESETQVANGYVHLESHPGLVPTIAPKWNLENEFSKATQV